MLASPPDKVSARVERKVIGPTLSGLKSAVYPDELSPPPGARPSSYGRKNSPVPLHGHCDIEKRARCRRHTFT